MFSPTAWDRICQLQRAALIGTSLLSKLKNELRIHMSMVTVSMQESQNTQASPPKPDQTHDGNEKLGRLHPEHASQAHDEDMPAGVGADPSDSDASAAWTECARVVQIHSEEMVKRWKDEIDTLLVYAGLFSGIITAFNVQSYNLLQASSPDASVALLAQISDQLRSFSLNPPFINSTSIPAPTPPSFRVPRSAVWINALWFSSLICSLSAASIGIMVKQWLHEAEVGLSGTSREAARVRQYRYDGLRKWQVGTIVATLPILLQLAAILFFAGLLVLLWTLHPVVATVASILVGILFSFIIGTVILPAFLPDCTYRSPQALGVFLVMQALGRLLRPALNLVARVLEDRGVRGAAIHQALLNIVGSDWGSFRGWAGRDRVETAFAQNTLDEHTLRVADAVALDNRFLEEYVRPCVRTLPSWSAIRCYRKIRASRTFHLGPLWGQYASLGHHYEAQVELTLDVIERCLNDSVRLYNLEDLNPIVQELLLRLQYPLSQGVSERCGRAVAGVVALRGDFLTLALAALHTRTCLADECHLDVSVREVIDALEHSIEEVSLERRPTITSSYADVVASIALHPHILRGQHCDYVKDRLKRALVSVGRVLESPVPWEQSPDALGFWLVVARLLDTLLALERETAECWSRDLLVRLEDALARHPTSQVHHSRDMRRRIQELGYALTMQQSDGIDTLHMQGRTALGTVPHRDNRPNMYPTRRDKEPGGLRY